MASRLKLKKRKKYLPPIDDFEEKLDDDKTVQEQDMNSDSRITKKSIKPTEPKQQPKIDLNKSFAQMVGNFNKTEIEEQIFINAIASAEKHRIKLKAGRKDRGYGNCAFESVINNINDRACYKEQLIQSPNWYRHIWMEEMKKRIILGVCPLYPGYSDKEISEGFEVVKKSGFFWRHDNSRNSLWC